MCILYVEVIRTPENLSKAGKRSSIGTNYEVWHLNDEDMRDKTINLYGGNIQVDKKSEGEGNSGD